jgi:hypothetical protein
MRLFDNLQAYTGTTTVESMTSKATVPWKFPLSLTSGGSGTARNSAHPLHCPSLPALEAGASAADTPSYHSLRTKMQNQSCTQRCLRWVGVTEIRHGEHFLAVSLLAGVCSSLDDALLFMCCDSRCWKVGRPGPGNQTASDVRWLGSPWCSKEK